jgi:hypothetical protein
MLAIALALVPLAPAVTDNPWVVYEGGQGPGAGKHIVWLSGDEEYRSEEALPMLAKILSVRHGFRSTVLFATNPETGEIDPDEQTNVPGMAVLETADLVVCFFRFRELPDEDMAHFVRYVESGKPIIGLRTATHAFAYNRHKDSPYARYDWHSKEWPGGFGQQILGDTWVAHHGHHGSESTRGVIEASAKDHPILRGVTDVWGPTDVYAIAHLPSDATVLLRGANLAGMTPDSPVVEDERNDPMMPITWVRELDHEGGHKQRVLCSTIGAAIDFENEDLRRLMVNACYWAVGLEKAIPEHADATLVGPYEPTFFGFGQAKKGVRAADHTLAK